MYILYCTKGQELARIEPCHLLFSQKVNPFKTPSKGTYFSCSHLKTKPRLQSVIPIPIPVKSEHNGPSFGEEKKHLGPSKHFVCADHIQLYIIQYMLLPGNIQRFYLTTTENLNFSSSRYVDTSPDNIQRFYLTTTDNLLDREHPDILKEGGLYIFQASSIVMGFRGGIFAVLFDN